MPFLLNLATSGLVRAVRLASGGTLLSDTRLMPVPNTLRPVCLPYEDEVAECFVRVKHGAGIEELQDDRKKAKQRLVRLNSECNALSVLLRNGNEAKGPALLRRQDDRHEARLELARINEQLSFYAERHQDQSLIVQELEKILCLPQILAARAENPSVIVFTVHATTVYRSILYHLGTWDVFFGNVEDMEKGEGDEDHFRVKRVAGGPIRNVGPTEFHNWSDGSFCFGTNRDRLEEYAKKGDFLHGMQAIIMYLSTIKQNKRLEIPKTFKKIEGATR